jgi:hypothetical protein
VDEFSKPFAGTIASDDSIGGIDGKGDAISEAELHEFLAADSLGAPADPAFKDRLQGRLWEIVQTRVTKKLHHKWMHGWRRRDVAPVEDVDPAARDKRRRGPA